MINQDDFTFGDAMVRRVVGWSSAGKEKCCVWHIMLIARAFVATRCPAHNKKRPAAVLCMWRELLHLGSADWLGIEACLTLRVMRCFVVGGSSGICWPRSYFAGQQHTDAMLRWLPQPSLRRNVTTNCGSLVRQWQLPECLSTTLSMHAGSRHLVFPRRSSPRKRPTTTRRLNRLSPL